MALDPSIAMGVRPIQFDNPLNSLAQALQVQNLQQQNQLGGVNLATQQQALDERNKLRALFADPSFNMQDPSSVQKVMSISPAQGIQLQKTLLENKSTQSTIDKNSSEILAKRTALYRDSLANVNDPQTAAQYVTALYNDPVFKGTPVTSAPIEQALARIPQDPQGFAQWKNQEALGASKFIEMNKPTYHNMDDGQIESMLAIPGLGGAPSVVAQQQKRVSPDAVLRAQTSVRGQNMTNARLGAEFGKPPVGYRFKPNGDLEMIPGGPADQKTQLKEAGGQTVTGIVSGLRDMYNQLDQAGGITNPERGALSNLAASTSSSGLGQAVGRGLGTQNQSMRNTIAQQRPLLLQAIMKATGMSAKQMDSNVELKLYLATATDPTLDVAANRRALDKIEQLYGLGNGKATSSAPSAPAKVVDFGSLK